MKIQGPGFVQAPQSMSMPHRTAASQTPAASSLAEADQLDISAAGDLASRSLETGNVRQDRVAQIRAAIEGGTYETNEKLSVALDRLLDEIG
jgi:negative regulator of flagellin synthesis FlgM